LFVTEATEQLSAVIGVPSEATIATQVPVPTFTVMFKGQVIVGTMLSILFTLNVHVDMFPLESVTVRVTTVVPTPETGVPAAGDCVTVTTPQGSLAVASEV